MDSKKNVPLFNNKAWSRANNVLKEILAGHASDPPGFIFYHQKLDAKGEPAFDSHGIALLDCARGSNFPENVHKQITTTFGEWCTGVEMADALMAEFRHRYNQHVAERRRSGFPKLGMYDTWEIDSLQIIVERNHGVLLFPEWSNTSDFITTSESFGTVPIHSVELGDAIACIVLPEPAKLSFDQRYISTTMGTRLPPLPVHGRAECTLFISLVLASEHIDFDAMAITRCKHVDGVHIFPKLPVYLRTHHTAWQRSVRVRDAVRAAATGEARLKALNEETTRQLFGGEGASPATGASPAAASPAAASPAAASPAAASPAAVSPAVTPAATAPAATAPAPTPAATAPTATAPAAATPATTAPAATAPAPAAKAPTATAPAATVLRGLHQHRPMPQPWTQMAWPVEEMPLVGGVMVGGASVPGENEKRRNGQRSSDKQPRRKRACWLCCKFGGSLHGLACNGRGGRKKCEYFNEDGSPKGAGDQQEDPDWEEFGEEEEEE